MSAVAIPAAAADLSVIPDSLYESPGSDLTGFRIGVVVGGHAVDVDIDGVDAIDDASILGGVFAGYDFENGGIVYGVEGDIEASAFDTTVSCPNAAWDCNASINALGSLRGRLGFAMDDLLLYGTAGLAVANVTGATDNGVATFPDHQVRLGWTVGAGVELAMGDNWFGRAEYRYSDFGTADMDFDVVYEDVSVRSHALRAGIGYRF